MSLKIYSMKNNNFKNPVSALFKQLMITIYGFLDSFLRPIIEKKIYKIKLENYHKLMQIGKNTLDNVNDILTEEKIENKNVENIQDLVENIKTDNNEIVKKESLEVTNEKNYEKEEIDENEINNIQNDNDKLNNLENQNFYNEKSENQNSENENLKNENINEINSLGNHKKENLEELYSDSISLKKIKNLKIKNDEIDLSDFITFEIYETSLSVFKNLILISEGKKKDWIASSVYSKCLGMELIAGIICQSGWVMKFLPQYVNLIKTDLFKIIKKNFETSNDYAIGLKLSRLSVQIIQNVNICYDLIPFILKYSENQLVPWQKLIGLECIANFCSNSYVLKDLYEKKFETDEKLRINIYDDILSTLTKVSYASVTTKPNDPKKKEHEKKDNIKYQKNIENSIILAETDIIIPTYSFQLLLKLITECYQNLRDSYVVVLENSDLKLGLINREYNEDQLIAKDIVYYNYEAIKNSMTALIVNSNDETLTQNYLMIFQSYINIFGSITLPIARDSYLNDLCKLAIPNNLENSFELNTKNILISKTLFNIAHCVNILDSNSWLLLIETMQKIYLMLINSNNHLIKPNEEFDIDVIIKNLETNIKKYDPNFGVSEEKTKKSNIDESGNMIIEEKKNNEETSESNKIQDENSKSTNTNTESHYEKKKGIFSSLKSAFGFSKSTKTENNNVNNVKKNMEENIDIQILSGAIDTLFINSSFYEEDTLKDITKAFLESSKTIFANNPVANDITNIYVNFNLTKLLELAVINVNRIPLFWDSIINLITFIAQKNANNISRFSLDCLTIIVMFLLSQYNSGKIEFYTRSSIHKNTIEKLWDNDNWQNTLFIPFKNISMLNVSQNININIIYNLSKILQNSGISLNLQGWNNYIQICDILVSKNDEIICENVFRLIEQIINEYSEYLTLNNVNCLINNLEIFSQYNKNTNICFIAVTMFWNISGIAEKFVKLIKLNNYELNENKIYLDLTDYQKDFFIKYKTVEERVIYTNNIWLDFFSKIVGICSDNTFDVRKSAINIFADIFVAKNFLLENNVATEIINKYFLEILDKSYTIFEEKMKSNRINKNVTNESTNQSKTPKFNDISDIKLGDFKVDQLKLPERKIKFDEEIINKLNQPSAEEIEWEDTTILLSQGIGKVLRSFLNKNLEVIKDLNYYTENLLNSLIRKFSKIMRITTPKVASTILGCLQEIYNSNIDLFFSQFENLWKIYDEMGKFITTDFYLNNLCTMATSSKMISNVLEILKELFLKEKNLEIKPDLLSGRNLANLLSFTDMLIKSSRNSEGTQGLSNPQRILLDEKIIFEFIEKISKILDNPESWKIYSDFLCSYIIFDLNNLHSEAHCRKALDMYETFVNSIVGKLTGGEDNKKSSIENIIPEEKTEKNKNYLILEFINDNIQKLLDCIKDLCSLRNKNEYVSVLLKNNKSQTQIWHYSSFQLIKILSLILCKNTNRKDDDNYPGLYSPMNITQLNFSSNFNSNLKETDNLNIEIQMNEIWGSSIRCFETIFRQSEIGYKNISRNLLEDLLKSCQEMEIQIINFIVNALLPNSIRIPKEMQIKLLTLLDIGSNFDYNILSNLSQTSTNTSSISRVCIENLFELCKYKSEESLKKGKYNFFIISIFIKYKIFSKKRNKWGVKRIYQIKMQDC